MGECCCDSSVNYFLCWLRSIFLLEKVYSSDTMVSFYQHDQYPFTLFDYYNCAPLSLFWNYALCMHYTFLGVSGAFIHFKFYKRNVWGGGGVNSLVCRFYAYIVYVSLISHNPITRTTNGPIPDRQETQPKITIH